MITQSLVTVFLTASLGAFSPVAAPSQHEDHPGKKGMSHDPMMMTHEPHHALAMAYHQNLVTFTKALHDQTKHAKALNVEFARLAVAEMRRSFDQMKQHRQEHMKTMSTEMHTKMSGMMQKMETHQIELNTQITALEQEVQLPAPDAKKVGTLTSSLHSRLDAMTKVHVDGQGKKMEMKMKK